MSRRALGVTLLSISGAWVIAACASGGLDDQPTGEAGGPGVFAGGSSGISGAPNGNGGSAATNGGNTSGTTGGNVGNGGSSNVSGATGSAGASTTSGGSSSSNGGSSTTNGGSTSGTMGGNTSAGTTSGGATGNCMDTPPPNGDTCAHAVEYGWCTQDWLNGACARSCGKCSGGASGGSANSGGATGKGGSGNGGSGNQNGGTTSKGGSSNGGSSSGGMMSTSGGSGTTLPPITGGTNGWGSRYWDCCKPSCGWKTYIKNGNPGLSCNASNASNGSNYDIKSSCDGGDGFACWNQHPWSVSDTLSYGYIAANQPCGTCFQLQFTGKSQNGNQTNVAALNGKSMIVQVTNFGGLAANQFDIMIPGGGLGDFTEGCKRQISGDLGAGHGGLLTTCNHDKNCVRQRCQTLFAGKQDLMDGCTWFLDWFNGADNPSFVYKKVACPAAITQRSGLSDPG